MNYAYYITITLQYTAWKKQRGENWALTEIWNYFQHAVAYVGHKLHQASSVTVITGLYEIYMSTFCRVKPRRCKQVRDN